MEIFENENVLLKQSIMKSFDLDDPITLMKKLLSLNMKGINSNPILKEWYNRDVFSKIEKLSEKGCEIIGEFSCSGEYSPLRFNLNCEGKLAYIAGREKGHPNEKDMESARVFAKGLLNL